MPRSSRTEPQAGPENPEDPPLVSCVPQWVARSLADNGIRRLGEAGALSDAELLRLRGVGAQSVKLIRTAIRNLRRRRNKAPPKG